MPIFTVGAAGTTSSSFDIAGSAMFHSNSLASRTPSSAGNRRTYTISQWAKKSSLATSNNVIFCAGESTNDQLNIFFRDTLTVQDETSNVANFTLVANAVFRDTSAWYHVVLAVDTTQSTASDRVKLYVNGQQITSFSTEDYPTQNVETNVNRTINHSIAGRGYQSSQYFDGYLAECILVDGQQLTPTSFGEFDTNSGIWKPIDPSGITFGTNGHYYNFATKATDPVDASGNGLNMSSSNVLTTDYAKDTPLNNYCVLNILTSRGGGTIEEGNLKYTASGSDSSIFGTLGIPPGMKVYFEVLLQNNTAQNAIGIHNQYDPGGTFVKGGSVTGTYSFKPRGSASVTQYFNNGSSTNTSTSNYSNNTIIGVAVDNENGQIHYHANGTYINSSDPTDNNPVALVTGFDTSKEQYLHFSLDTTVSQPVNLYNFGSPLYSISSGNSDANGHGNFEYAVPSGYYALNTKNLAEFG